MDGKLSLRTVLSVSFLAFTIMPVPMVGAVTAYDSLHLMTMARSDEATVLDPPDFELLAPPARAAAQAMMVHVQDFEEEQAKQVVLGAGLNAGEQHFLLASYHYEMVEYPECSNAFSEAARSRDFSDQLRAYSWLMAYHCRWLGGDKRKGGELIPEALRSGVLSRKDVNYFLNYEAEGWTLPHISMEYMRTGRGSIQRRLATEMDWDHPYFGVVMISFRLNQFGQPEDVDVITAYPDAGASQAVEAFITGKALKHKLVDASERVLLQVVLSPRK